MTEDDAVIETTENSLTIRRVIDAPRERVFRAFVDPNDIEAWQSIGDMTVEVHTIEPEPGGSLSMSHMPGDDRFDFEGEFLEIVENERIVHTLQVVDGPFTGEKSRITVELRKNDDGTEVEFSEDPVDPEMLEDTVTTWDRMLQQIEGVLAEA